MNVLVEKGYLDKKNCGSNLSFILNDNNIFLTTEYKVLQSQANTSFIKCMRVYYNGRMQLYYLTQSYRPLSVMLSTLDDEGLMTVIINLFSNIIDVKNNGFLSCQNIDVSFEHIYVDSATYKVSLIYLPVKKRLYDDYSTFENVLRVELIKVVSNLPVGTSARIRQLLDDLSNGTLGLEEICSKVKDNQNGVMKSEVSQKKNEGTKNFEKMILVAMDAPSEKVIEIAKNEVLVGKDPSAVDAVISYNATISRVHCKIFRKNSLFFVHDLNSTNGTFVNNVRIPAGKEVQINNGDIIRLSNSNFQVEFR